MILLNNDLKDLGVARAIAVVRERPKAIEKLLIRFTVGNLPNHV